MQFHKASFWNPFSHINTHTHTHIHVYARNRGLIFRISMIIHNRGLLCSYGYIPSRTNAYNSPWPRTGTNSCNRGPYPYRKYKWFVVISQHLEPRTSSVPYVSSISLYSSHVCPRFPPWVSAHTHTHIHVIGPMWGHVTSGKVCGDIKK